MKDRAEQRAAVRAVVAAARHAERAQDALAKAPKGERAEMRVQAEAACARVVRMLLDPVVLSSLAMGAGPLPRAGEGEGA